MDLGKEIRIIQVEEELAAEEQTPYQPLVEFAKLVGKKSESFGFEPIDRQSPD